MENRIYARMAAASAGLLMLAAGSGAQTKWSYPNCPDVTDSDFKVDTLMRRGIAPDPNLAEPDKLAFDMDDNGNVDVYFTEIRPGNIKRYNAKTKTVTTLVKLPNWGGGNSNYLTVGNAAPVNSAGNVEEGVTGIALDPDFKTNKWLYVHWSPLPADKPVFRISRFKVEGDKINLGTEKVILEIEAQRDECCHTGGSMAFDAYGDLWIAQGANGGRGSNSRIGNPPEGINEVKKYDSEEWGASNTHGLRGGFIRIHPDDSPKGYSIPAGNFGEYYYTQTKNAQYLDTSKVRPEVYIKGTRNNYSMALDPVRRWVLWGDVGPDGTSPVAREREEFNLRKTPGFEGWPYFVGNNTTFVGDKDPAAPTNTSKWNTGLTVLPPARPATKISAIGTSPISGPLYLYDGDSKSTIKLPPHFNRMWFVTDYTSSQVNVFTLNADATQVTKAERIFANIKLTGPIDFRQGPDGALYLSNYGPTNFTTGTNTSIMKIYYTGSCRPALPRLESPTGLAETRSDMVTRRSGLLINLDAMGSVQVPQGMSGIEITGISGRRVLSKYGLKPGERFTLPAGIHAGALKYRWVPAGPQSIAK